MLYLIITGSRSINVLPLPKTHFFLNIHFSGLKCLDSLGMAHNNLKIIPARAFFHLNNLNSLELDGNYITHIHVDAFIGLEGMISLEF